MNTAPSEYQVAIVGGGPVGLFLGYCLRAKGISCIILEKRSHPVTHSRSIGIHPISLEYFETMGLADAIISEGVKVAEGMAFAGKKHMGTLTFTSCPPPYQFILTLPQYKTEQLLASRLNVLDPSVLQRGAEVTKMTESDTNIRLGITGKNKEISAHYVVACDGKNSTIREWASISFAETIYDDTYIMGDFSDNTSWGTKAAVFLCKEGLIESFPLPGTLRRWVLKTDRYLSDITRRDIEERVARRIGHSLDGTKNTMLSSFGVQKGLAQTLAKNRILLAGDAAHVVSPIGGQGMNLGWLDARHLAGCFVQIFNTSADPTRLLQQYSTRQLKIARKIIRRAEFNMALGRKTKNLYFKKVLLSGMLKTPLANLMARIFTMRGLTSLPF